MVQWILAAYAIFIIFVGTGAVLMAFLVLENEPDRRKTAFSILKPVLGTGTGVAGIGALAPLAVRLTEAGLM